MKKRTSIYANMTASDLARVTRERGLAKPDVITISEWADFLEADDAKRAQAPEFETVDALDDKEDDTEEIAPKSDSRKKGKG